jgi:anti-sigma factor ChrR (cupin superfamily)
MRPHEFLDDDLRETAALFVLDALEPEDARVWRLHLVRCAACRGEVTSLAASARELVQLAPEEAPRPEVWDRVLDRIRSARVDLASETASSADREGSASPAASGQVWKAWSDSSDIDRKGFLFVGFDDVGFEPTGFEGVEARRLFVDHDHDRVTMLVRMQPGARYPGHVHAGAEECYVVAGDLFVGDRRMHAGDFQRARAGSRHPVQSTEKGCVLLLTSSLHDELSAEDMSAEDLHGE